MSIEEYRSFIASKHGAQAQKVAIANPLISPMAKYHQVKSIEFACEKGRSALFLDTGLGKSFCQLEFARLCAEETGKPSLILTPLAVAAQMVREGRKFGIGARQIKEKSEVGQGVMVANYERLPKLDPNSFGAVILDESSILKSFQGKTRTMMIAAFKDTPYKLAATATPSPNDHMELGNHAEFLDVIRQQEMLSKWFINDTSTASQDWRLKGHAKDDFWQFVASWSRCATLPSDLGGGDTGYVLPPIELHMHQVEADRHENTDGMLFRIPELSATSFHKEKRMTLKARCDKASELATHDSPVTVWCESNDESAYLAKHIPDAREITGSMTPEKKEELILGFLDGSFRVLVCKPKLAGFGLNFQLGGSGVKILTETDTVSKAIDAWASTYGLGKYNGKPRYVVSWQADVWAKLCDLKDPEKQEIDSIIGNDSWTCVECDECASKVKAVAVFETSEFPLHLCHDCLVGAANKLVMELVE